MERSYNTSRLTGIWEGKSVFLQFTFKIDNEMGFLKTKLLGLDMIKLLLIWKFHIQTFMCIKFTHFPYLMNEQNIPLDHVLFTGQTEPHSDGVPRVVLPNFQLMAKHARNKTPCYSLDNIFCIFASQIKFLTEERLVTAPIVLESINQQFSTISAGKNGEG